MNAGLKTINVRNASKAHVTKTQEMFWMKLNLKHPQIPKRIFSDEFVLPCVWHGTTICIFRSSVVTFSKLVQIHALDSVIHFHLSL